MGPPEHVTLPTAPLGALLWRLPPRSVALSSAVVGGGWSQPAWILNLQVERDYARTDVDAHATEVARSAGLAGTGLMFLTAADVTRYGDRHERGLRVEATAGVSDPTWAAAPDEPGEPTTAGTVNIVARAPVALEPAAAVNAIATITEAKCQAFFERGIPGTGTATDAIAIVWSVGEEPAIRFCGPRSRWGAVLARVTRDAVGAAIDQAVRSG